MLPLHHHRVQSASDDTNVAAHVGSRSRTRGACWEKSLSSNAAPRRAASTWYNGSLIRLLMRHGSQHVTCRNHTGSVRTPDVEPPRQLYIARVINQGRITMPDANRAPEHSIDLVAFSSLSLVFKVQRQGKLTRSTRSAPLEIVMQGLTFRSIRMPRGTEFSGNVYGHWGATYSNLCHYPRYIALDAYLCIKS